MQTQRYAINAELPVVVDADVVIVGGGPGGVGAAVTAARSGARTVLIERYGCLGGMASFGEVHPFMPNHADGISLDRPVFDEWVRRMYEYLPPDWRSAHPLTSEHEQQSQRYISKDLAMLAAEDMVTEAGAEILYHHTLVDVVGDRDKHIKTLVLHSKSGLAAAVAKVYIDCTGDADLAALAGAECEQGGPTGHCQPMSLCFKVSGVDKARTPEPAALNQLFLEARQAGLLDIPREEMLHFNWFDDDVVHFNCTRIIHRSATDGRELSQAEQQGRRQLRQVLAFLRSKVSGYENCRVHSIAHHVGVRESRRVCGLARLELADYINASKFDDAIARCRYAIDIHSPDGAGVTIRQMPPGQWFEIPYGCIVARDIDNLLVGGRCISVSHEIHSSTRVMPPAVSVGQAAGMAAAMACKAGLSPHDLDGCAVRQALVGFGANL